MNLNEVENIFDLNKLNKDKKGNLEKALSSNELNEEQKLRLVGACYIYSHMEIKPIHKEKYDSYEISDLIKGVKDNKNPSEILKEIISECEEYSKTQMFKSHLKTMGTGLS